jgi:hypothetical protein
MHGKCALELLEKCFSSRRSGMYIAQCDTRSAFQFVRVSSILNFLNVDVFLDHHYTYTLHRCNADTKFRRSPGVRGDQLRVLLSQ